MNEQVEVRREMSTTASKLSISCFDRMIPTICLSMINLNIITLLYLSSRIVSVNAGGAQHNGKDVIRGMEVRASAYDYPPLFSIIRQPDGNYTYVGVSADALILLTQVLHVTIKYVHVDPKEVALYDDVDGALKMQLQRNEVDIAPYLFEVTSEMLNHMALAHPVWISQYTLLQPWPKEQSRLTAPIRPFSWMVWLCLLGATIIFVAFMSGMAVVEKNKSGRGIMFRDALRSGSFWGLVYTQLEYVLTIITSQGNYLRYTANTAIRVGIVLWLLAMVVLINAYTGTLTAFLTVPVLEPIVTSLRELATLGKYRLITEEVSLLAQLILNGTEDYYQAFREDFRKDPSLLSGDPIRILDNVLNKECVYAGTEQITNYFIRVDVSNYGSCRMTVPTRPLPYSMPLMHGFQKDFPFLDIFKLHYYMPGTDYGFLQHIIAKYFPPNKKCRADAPPESKIKVISLIDLTAPFVILIGGLSMAALAFLLENVNYYISEKITID